MESITITNKIPNYTYNYYVDRGDGTNNHRSMGRKQTKTPLWVYQKETHGKTTCTGHTHTVSGGSSTRKI